MNAIAPTGSQTFARVMGPVARELLGKPSSETAHDILFGTRGSMCVSLDKGTWFDHEANEGGGVLDLLRKRLGLETPAAIAWLRERNHIPAASRRGGMNIVATYDYTTVDGVLLFQVCRLDPKDFRPRHRDENGKWLWNMSGVQRVLYRLPDVSAAVASQAVIYLTEGEKAADRVAAMGLTATCSPAGANKWRKEYSPSLAGADVVILPDNDDVGAKHAASVAKALQGIATRLRVLALPDLPAKGDVADWIDSGGTAAQLTALTDVASDYDEGPDLDALADPAGYGLTEDGIALAFTARHGAQLRFCHDTGSWYEWTGAVWRQERTKLAFSWARQTCRELARQGSDKQQTQIAKAAFAAAVERFAQSDRVFAVTSETWDSDPWLLGTPGKTVELRTGELRPARQGDFITKQTAVAPAATPDCPLWLDFLNQATAGDDGLIRFLRQWCGYSLTGDTREHALMFGFGPGGNGKSVFLNTVAGIMGAYARIAAMETFTASQGDKHPTDLAMLRGARLVCANETEEGRAWAEVRIKQLTGGDTITARFMRQDFFEFRPQFKLVVIGNHKPGLKNVDEAARRRFNVVPFLHKPANPDRELETKLKAEWPAILRWMIEGCLDWQRHGLVRPQVVKDATAEYFSEQDVLAQWVEDQCETGSVGVYDTTASLFSSWQHYTHARGEEAGSAKRFVMALQRLGFKPVRDVPGRHNQRGFAGVRVRFCSGQ